MTKKEAKDLLDNLIGMVKDNHGADYDTALKMAIKALEHPEKNVVAVVPCGDAISRQAVMLRVREFIGNPTYTEKMLVDDLNNLPSVTPKYTETEIQKMQDLECAEIEKAYELGKMEAGDDQWQELKETIIGMRDNDGTGTQQEVCKFLANLMDILEKQMKDEWIPVSERLPEDTEPVNITWVNHNPELYYAAIKDKPFTATGCYCDGKWYWYSVPCQDYLDECRYCDVDSMAKEIEVIAWMPLPEPYKAESEDKDDN